jgi:hypothetical protein
MLRRARPALLLIALAGALLPATAGASGGQESTFQDDNLLLFNTPGGTAQTLDTLKGLGVDRVRVSVFWRNLAPANESATKPPFDAADPGAYPAAAWEPYDRLVREADRRSIRVNFNPTSPAPNWATGTPERTDIDETFDPDPREYGLFVRALGTRYSGSYEGLPRVDYWGIWNEPNQPGWLTPQWAPAPGEGPAGRMVEAAPRIYRALFDAAFEGLGATGHGQDTILLGETAPKGLNVQGTTRAIKAARFIRRLFCLNEVMLPLTGRAAEEQGCPTADGAHAFPVAHPGLFAATGYAHHPYELVFAPSRKPTDRDFLTVASTSRLAVLLKRAFARYGRRGPGQHGDVPLFFTEFGYQTNPPDRFGVTPARQQAYLDEAEYLTAREPNVRTLSQFLLLDDADIGRGFQSGLMFRDGRPKPALATYRLPVHLPGRRPDRRGRLKVWGMVRAALPGAGSVVKVQARRGRRGRWRTLRRLTPANAHGYFQTSVTAGRSAGAVRLLAQIPDANGALTVSLRSRVAPFAAVAKTRRR